ncbi:MAG: Na/Pi symporter [Bacilli bacterium]|nr:Na/Pi symporter [Bacilli bacterium]MDD4387655.1 Na/Pi symporter [Bacilli bacterium]
MVFVGGLSIFMFGLNHMRESLIKISSERIKKFIASAAGSKLKALITGVVITVFIQSSSGVTAIVVALVSANLMTMYQGIMVMIGANIGTTTTAFLFALHIENYSLIIIFIGFFLNYFNNLKLKHLGEVITGLGLLFLGIYIMNSFYANIAASDKAVYYTMLFSGNRITSFLTGTVISALIQSSSGTINIVQNLYFINAINLTSAVSLVLGANLGTTIASLIVAISSTKEAKTAINVNIVFNLIGGVIFMIFLRPYCNFLSFLECKTPLILNKKIMIAYSHLLYNIIATIIFYFSYDRIISKLVKVFSCNRSKKNNNT